MFERGGLPMAQARPQVHNDDPSHWRHWPAPVRRRGILPVVRKGGTTAPKTPLWEDAPAMYTAEFSDSSSDVDSLEVCWDLDPFINLDQDGSSDDDCDISGPEINGYSWSEAGTYPAIFHVTDDDGSRTAQTVNFTVRNRQP